MRLTDSGLVVDGLWLAGDQPIAVVVPDDHWGRRWLAVHRHYVLEVHGPWSPADTRGRVCFSRAVLTVPHIPFPFAICRRRSLAATTQGVSALRPGNGHNCDTRHAEGEWAPKSAFLTAFLTSNSLI